jgi:hypothetical protein
MLRILLFFSGSYLKTEVFKQLYYIKRKNKQKNAGHSFEGLALFIRFRGKSSLL